ncbi:hypothetical protein ACFFF7_00290 [Novosphingobium aquiterrae]|uniref:Uncharacterized protein n=1 Tax=Novosphingobium aquiterrae TaxID=624388 RepID=A0ABV6PE31_9SPHN
MPTSLSQHRHRLTIQVKTLNAGFTRHLGVKHKLRQLDKVALREGLISPLWQYWGQFVRSVLIDSAKGAIQDNGALTTCPYSIHTEEEIAFVCMQLAQKNPINLIKPIKGPHLEPTWGDVDKAILIASNLGVSNDAQILSGLAIPLSIRDLQTCRNATAHLGKATFSDLKSAKVRYSDTKLLHPTDAMMWSDPSTLGYLWDTWVDQILMASEYVCK